MDIREQRAIGKKPRKELPPPAGDPTQAEIAAASRMIQAEWTESERARRSSPDRPVDMTVVHRVVESEE